MGFLKGANIYWILYNAKSASYIHDLIYSILIACQQDWINMPILQIGNIRLREFIWFGVQTWV